MCPSWDDLCFALPIVGTNVEMSPSYDPEYSPKLTLVTSDSKLATSAKAETKNSTNHILVYGFRVCFRFKYVYSSKRIKWG